MKSSPFPNELYNTKTLYTLSGASVSVWLFTAVIGSVFNINMSHYKWLGLIVAIFLSIVGALKFFEKSLNFITVTFFNGLLIYVTASGIDSINHSVNIDNKQKNSSLIPFTKNEIWWVPKEYSDSVTSLKSIIRSDSQTILKYEKTIKILEDSLSKNNKNVKSISSITSIPVSNNDQLMNLYRQQLAINKMLKDSLSRYIGLKNTNPKQDTKNTDNQGLNLKLTESNIKFLNTTSAICQDILKRVQAFEAGAKYNPTTQTSVYLQKDISTLEYLLKSDIDQINALLTNYK
jgi:hypothetical protein